MEKNIKKRVCRLAAVLSAGLVVLFGRVSSSVFQFLVSKTM